MFSSPMVALAAVVGSAVALPQFTSGTCTPERRIAIAKQIPYAYSQDGVVAVYEAFHDIPFGVGNLDGPCVTEIYPNGGGPVLVGVTGQGVVNFGTETRQAFSSVTGRYVDFPHNGTTVIYTEVTLGVNSVVPIPTTFSGEVYLDYNSDCRITAVRAYAEVPTYILGQPTDIYKLLPIPKIPSII
ncbi:unnamed protein product [Zymoseptoria tritici ST99CH_1A5]|uniref:Ubiquitin 3 binding protein But2 C-terminal domain-containing protein n=3 Tax=Zymoseptoria tritici TaxID=1047171 RepID=A0A1X7RGZ3_ZYMT9|nr:unnamed protein product [Zymoseptoria tritici ST99CH_3D7]SMR43055.1 unnamed protein product [Zymoseptoria tritici ST99CH_1E4]SMR45222.1 unnamed protein product [Zymoseptoria tritici ST99CH_3D1]SMY20386.1 unnamed protein product [Zymoseptoria tritici ST99CH_1A5]